MKTDELQRLFTNELERHERELDAWARKNGIVAPEQKIVLNARIKNKIRTLVPQRKLTKEEWNAILEINWTDYQLYVIKMLRKAATEGRALKYADVCVPRTVRGKFIMGGGRFGPVDAVTYRRINQRFLDAKVSFAIVEDPGPDDTFIKLAVCSTSLL